MSYRILHLQGSEQQGGAAQAAQAVRELLPDAEHLVRRLPSTTWRSAVSEIGGYCDPYQVWRIRVGLRRLEPRPDVVHCHRLGPWGTAAIVAAKREGLRVVYSAYDHWALCPRANLYNPAMGGCDHHCLRCYRPKDGRWPIIANLALIGRRRRILRHLNQVDRIIALSGHQRDLLRAHGVTAPISVIPVPVTVPDLGTVERVRGRVLFVGWLAPNKGAHVAVEAVRLLREKGVAVTLRLIGPRAHQGYLWPMPDWVEWLGPQTRETTLREIAAAAVLVVPEQWDNPQPLVLCEAMLLGTPVVASHLGGIPEIVSECNGDGVLLDPTSVQHFAAAIRMYVRYSFNPASDESVNLAYLSPDRLRPLLEEVYHG